MYNKDIRGGDILETAKHAHLRNPDRLQALRYMDDDFMTACLADDFESVELILRIVLGREVKIRSIRTQEQLKNLRGRSAVLDVHATDTDNREMDIEIQRSDEGAGARRARHNSSLLDAHILRPGEPAARIPDSYVIFITENDVMKANMPLYPVDRYVMAGDELRPFNDGSHILYVNGRYRGDDEIGKLMHDFSCSDPDEMHFEPLARKARYYKRDEKGVAAMCKIVEDMCNEAAQEAVADNARVTAGRMIKAGKMPIEDIAEYTALPLEAVKELKEQLTQPA